MATNVEATIITNKVRYKSDISSLKKVMSDIRKLKDFSSKAMVASSPRQNVQQVRQVKRQVSDMMNAHIDAFKSVQKSRSRQMEKNSQDFYNSMFGIGAKGKSAKESAAAFQSMFNNENANAHVASFQKMQDRLAAIADKERRKQEAKDLAAAERARKKVEAAQQRANDLRRNRRQSASARESGIAFELSRTRLNTSQISKYQHEVQKLSDAYTNLSMSTRQYNEATRQILARARMQSKEFKTFGERLWEVRGRLLGIAAVAASAIYALNSVASATARMSQEAIARNQEYKKYQAQGGLGSDEAQALQFAVRRETGFDLSLNKLADVAKDVQDKVGDLSNGKWTQNKKTGEWNFGGGGEMSDWINMMVTRGGYGREEAVSTLRSVKGPGDLGALLTELQKKAKLSTEEFTQLAEVVNDFSWIAKAMGNEGENVVKAMKYLYDNGVILSDKQRENIDWLAKTSAVYQQFQESLSDNFVSSFAQGLKEAGIDSDALKDAFLELKPIVQDLGVWLGHLVGGIRNLLSYIPGSKSYNEQAYKDAQDNYMWAETQGSPIVSWLVKRWSSTSSAGEKGWQDAVKGLMNPNPTIPTSPQQAGINSPSGVPIINNNIMVKPADVKIETDTSKLEGVFSVMASGMISDHWSAQTDDLYSFQLNQ